jgi:hypothetical protein
MFDLTTTTILSLVLPTVIAPLACLAFIRAISRAESRKADRGAAPAPRVVLDASPAQVAGERVRERSVA